MSLDEVHKALKCVCVQWVSSGSGMDGSDEGRRKRYRAAVGR